ncbi:MAG TPA: efflux RND transporter periplasmic adaptor subunit, partial [Flavobacteriaceae bacterium]|nr:efflux RND transporter periplasmic adaptor subunit [Flavobacteriaceae bacterium]
MYITFYKIKISSIILLICFLFFNSCKQEQTKAKEDRIEKKQYLPEKNEVDVMILKQETFKKEIISNGKLIALQKNSLKFDVGENLEKIYIKNGDYVKKGQTLAVLKAFTYQQAYTKAKISLKKAELDFQDK